ncbi:STAS domain-containing protein [Streptomyces seoulensis]
MNDEPEISETVLDGVRIVRVTGEFDSDGADDAARCFAVPAEGPAPATVVDLAEVSFADSSLLHTLLTARQRHEEAGVPFVLAAVSPLVRRLLELTDTARAFTQAPDLAAALKLTRP